MSTFFTGTSALVHPRLRCSCLVCAQLSPTSQILRLSVIVVEEIGVTYEEDILLRVTWWAGGDKDNGN